MNYWESIVNIALCRYNWSLIISTGICTKVETKRVHTGFPCCIPSVDLRHYCLVTCTIECRKIYNHQGLELNSKTKQTKEQRKSFWVFQGLTKAKERRNLF